MNNSIFFNRSLAKKRLTKILSWYFLKFGEKNTIQFLEQLKELGFYWSTKAGISLSLDDLIIPPTKFLLISEADLEIEKTEKEYLRGHLTAVEKSQQLIDTWHRTSETLKKKVVQYFKSTNTLNPVYMMAFSGARGSISQVRQLVGMRGLMADPQGQIIDFPIRSNFREGLTLTEYIISCYGARKGVVDTALRTANSGYLTRRLIDVAQHVIVWKFNCETKRGIYLTDIIEENKIILSLEQRLVGRVLAEDIPPIAVHDQQIFPNIAIKLASLKKPVLVRSPLTCKFSDKVCILCYGSSLNQGHLVSMGEAVGVLAAQSIGEPGTQLTMRTFHTGGVFSGDVIKELRSSTSGIVNFPKSIAGALLRTPHGKIAFLTKAKGELQILSFEKNVQKIPIPISTIIFVRQGEKVVKRQLVAEFSSITTQINQRIESQHKLNSQMEGQLRFEKVNIQEKKNLIFSFFDEDLSKQAQNQKNQITIGNNMGSIWILSGKIYNSTNIFQKVGDLVNQNTIVNQRETNLFGKNLISSNGILPYAPVIKYEKLNLKIYQPLFRFFIKKTSYKNEKYFFSFYTISKKKKGIDFKKINSNILSSFLLFSNKNKLKNDSFTLNSSLNENFLIFSKLKKIEHLLNFYQKNFIFSFSANVNKKKRKRKQKNKSKNYLKKNKNLVLFSKKITHEKFLIKKQTVEKFKTIKENQDLTNFKLLNTEKLFPVLPSKNKNWFYFLLTKSWKEQKNQIAEIRKTSFLNWDPGKYKTLTGGTSWFDPFYFKKQFSTKLNWVNKIGILKKNKNVSSFFSLPKKNLEITFTIKYNVMPFLNKKNITFKTNLTQLQLSKKTNFRKLKDQIGKKHKFTTNQQIGSVFWIPQENFYFSKNFLILKKQNNWILNSQFLGLKRNSQGKVLPVKNAIPSSGIFLKKKKRVSFFNLYDKLKNKPKHYSANIKKKLNQLLKKKILILNKSLKITKNLANKKKKLNKKFLISLFSFTTNVSRSAKIKTNLKEILKNNNIIFSLQKNIFTNLRKKTTIEWSWEENIDNIQNSKIFEYKPVGSFDPIPLQLKKNVISSKSKRKSKKKSKRISKKIDFFNNTFFDDQYKYQSLTKINKKINILNTNKENNLIYFDLINNKFLQNYPKQIKNFSFLQKNNSVVVFRKQERLEKITRENFKKNPCSNFCIKNFSTKRGISIFNSVKINRNLISSEFPFLKSFNIENSSDTKKKIQTKKEIYFTNTSSPTKKFLAYKKQQSKKIPIKLNLKSGWIYLPKNQKQIINFHKQILQLGNFCIDDILFDQELVFLDCIPFNIKKNNFSNKFLLNEKQSLIKKQKYINKRPNLPIFIDFPFKNKKFYKGEFPSYKTNFIKMIPLVQEIQKENKLKKKNCFFNAIKSKNIFKFKNFLSYSSALSSTSITKRAEKGAEKKSKYKKKIVKYSKIYSFSSTYLTGSLLDDKISNNFYIKNSQSLILNKNQNYLERLRLSNIAWSFPFSKQKKNWNQTVNLQVWLKKQNYLEKKIDDKNLIFTFLIEKKLKKKLSFHLYQYNDDKNFNSNFEKQPFSLKQKRSQVIDKKFKLIFFSKKSFSSAELRISFQKLSIFNYKKFFFSVQKNKKYVPKFPYHLTSVFNFHSLETNLKKNFYNFEKFNFKFQKKENIFLKQNILEKRQQSHSVFLLIQKISQYSVGNLNNFKNNFYSTNSHCLLKPNLFNKQYFKNYSLTSQSNKQEANEQFLTLQSSIPFGLDFILKPFLKIQKSSKVRFYKSISLLELFIFFQIPLSFPFKQSKKQINEKFLVSSNRVVDSKVFHFTLQQEKKNKLIIINLINSSSNNFFEFLGINFFSLTKFIDEKKELMKDFVPRIIKIKKNQTLIDLNGKNVAKSKKNVLYAFSENKILKSHSKKTLNQQVKVPITTPITQFFSFYEAEIITLKKNKQSLFLCDFDIITFSIYGKKPFVHIGQFIIYGHEIADGIGIKESGQVIQIEKNKITIRKSQLLLLPLKSVIHRQNKEFINKNSLLLTLYYQRLITGDIVQGIPKIEQFFEARQTKQGEYISNNLPEILETTFLQYKKLPNLEAVQKSFEKVQQIIVEEIQKVYLSQGVMISDKHIEIIVRQMTSKVRIKDPGHTGLVQGEIISLSRVDFLNEGIIAQKNWFKDPLNSKKLYKSKYIIQNEAKYEPIIFGITKMALESESFISAASFQETTRILSRAAIEKKPDYLRGLKERVILGDLIRAGTGTQSFYKYKNRSVNNSQKK